MGKRGAVPVDGDGSGVGMKKYVDIGEVLDIRKKYRIYAGYTGSDKKRSTDFSEKNSSFTLPIRIRVSKGAFQIFDCQIAQSQVCFVPLSKNKKN